jgi:hypothetical protein
MFIKDESQGQGLDKYINIKYATQVSFNENYLHEGDFVIQINGEGYDFFNRYETRELFESKKKEILGILDTINNPLAEHQPEDSWKKEFINGKRIKTR